ncbi:MAG: hypothetical protein K1X82_08800 [Bacteroidia bacterium]|nr:hypothetical protein [Bacteroidia bacterium]
MKKGVFLPILLLVFASRAQSLELKKLGYNLLSEVSNPTDFLAKEGVVIATAGLALHEKPDVNSPVISIIPFAARVKFSQEKYDKLQFPYSGSGSSLTNSWTGYWEKVSFGSYAGYVCDAFLWDCIATATTPYVLISGQSATPLIGQDLTYYQFKVKTHDSDFFPCQLMKSNPEFRVKRSYEDHQLNSSELYIPGDTNREGQTTYYVVAQKKSPPLKQETKATRYVFETFSEAELALANQNELYLFEAVKENNSGFLYLTNRNTKVKQQLAVGCGDPIQIYLLEDLDGDAKPDVICSENCKGKILLRLFLSKKAGKGKLFQEMQPGLAFDLS